MLVSYGDTVVLVTVVGKTEVKPGQDFFPLTVDYQEKTYAAGKIPGGFFKREGRPSEKEILTCRLIDRPLRPLFPEAFYNEVQVIATVMSSDSEIELIFLRLSALRQQWAISGIPFLRPLGVHALAIMMANPLSTQCDTVEGKRTGSGVFATASAV